MATITSTNTAQAIVKLVAARALPALVGRLVMGNLVNRDYESTIATAGDVVNIAIPPIMAANNIAEAGSVSPQAPSLGNAQIVLNSHIESTFKIPDVTRALAVPDLLMTYLDPAVIAVAERIETDLLSLYGNFQANSVTGAGTTLDEARIDLAETALFTQKVPATAAKFLILSGTAYGQARQISRFSEYQMVGPNGQPSPMITGGLAGAPQADGTLKGMTVFRSQFVQKPSSITYNLAFARDAIGLVMRQLPKPIPGTGAIAEPVELGNFGFRVVMSYDPATLAQQFTVDALYGCGVVRNSFGVVVESN